MNVTYIKNSDVDDSDIELDFVLPSSTILYEVKNIIATKKQVPVDSLIVWAISYHGKRTTYEFDPDEKKSLAQYSTNNRHIEHVFVETINWRHAYSGVYST